VKNTNERRFVEKNAINANRICSAVGTRERKVVSMGVLECCVDMGKVLEIGFG